MNSSLKKTLKWTLIVIAVPALVAGLLVYNNWRDLHLAYRKSVGVYVVNLKKSSIQLLRRDSVELSGLKLILNPDGVFYFSHRVDYFTDSLGIWEIDGYGMDRYITIKMRGGRIYQMDTCCSNDSTISIAYPHFDKSNMYGSLAFQKLETDKEIK